MTIRSMVLMFLHDKETIDVNKKVWIKINLDHWSENWSTFHGGFLEKGAILFKWGPFSKLLEIIYDHSFRSKIDGEDSLHMEKMQSLLRVSERASWRVDLEHRCVRNQWFKWNCIINLQCELMILLSKFVEGKNITIHQKRRSMVKIYSTW